MALAGSAVSGFLTRWYYLHKVTKLTDDKVRLEQGNKQLVAENGRLRIQRDELLSAKPSSFKRIAERVRGEADS
jgi:hypothetical protein